MSPRTSRVGDVGIRSTDNCVAALIRAIIGLGAVVVTGSGNTEGSPYGYPALFGNPADRNYIPDLIVVGSVAGEGFRGVKHSDADWLTCYAPGYTVDVALSGTGNKYKSTMGTSFCTSSCFLTSISATSFLSTPYTTQEGNNFFCPLLYSLHRTECTPLLHTYLD